MKGKEKEKRKRLPLSAKVGKRAREMNSLESDIGEGTRQARTRRRFPRKVLIRECFDNREHAPIQPLWQSATRKCERAVTSSRCDCTDRNKEKA